MRADGEGDRGDIGSQTPSRVADRQSWMWVATAMCRELEGPSGARIRKFLGSRREAGGVVIWVCKGPVSCRGLGLEGAWLMSALERAAE